MTRSQERKNFAAWADVLVAGPLPARYVEVFRPDATVLNALSAQTQLEVLEVSRARYDDLTWLTRLTNLRHLRLDSAHRITDLSPLSALTGLLALEIEDLRDVDVAPLGALASLERLGLAGSWTSPTHAHLSSIGFLTDLRRLVELRFETLLVRDKDFSPLLELPDLRAVWVQQTRGMRPTQLELARELRGWDRGGPP